MQWPKSLPADYEGEERLFVCTCLNFVNFEISANSYGSI